MKVGVLQLITIWPFAVEQVKEVLSRVKGIIVPEMNLGQIASEIDRYNKRCIPLIRVNKVNSEIIMPGRNSGGNQGGVQMNYIDYIRTDSISHPVVCGMRVRECAQGDRHGVCQAEPAA